MCKGHKQTQPIPQKIQAPEHGPPRMILSVMEQILDQHNQVVLLHGPNPNLSVLILRKQLLQLINKMQTLSNRMETVTAIQELPNLNILQLSRLPEVVRHLVTPMNRLYIGYLEKLRHLHLVELQHLIELQEQQP